MEQNIAHYRITEKIGEGGMGAVYRATDTRLGRAVALKLLPETLSADPHRMARFQREAQLLASLNHPNIAAVHGLEEDAGRQVLVMELVEGPTLEDRISDGPVPLDEAIPIAMEMAEALEAAHDKGIIHRDLKPANIKLTPEGKVKILDFGLAKALEGESGSSPDLTRSPTLSIAATQAGVILGTAGYMSPEQARGKQADKRADIWAFGCVVYEIITGRPAFGGDTVSDILAAVIKEAPDLRALPESTPRALVRMLERCLNKDPLHRLRDVGDARITLEEIESAQAAGAPEERVARVTPTSPARSDIRRWALAGWTLAVALLIALVVVWQGGSDRRNPPATYTFSIPAPPGTRLNTLAISPDGRSLALAAETAAARQIWIHAMDSREPKLLQGTDDASDPFWSPDGRFVGFFAGERLKKVEVATGMIQELCEVYTPRGGTWGFDNNIVFSSSPLSEASLKRIPATGGTPEPVIRHDRELGENQHRFPSFLPDGEHVLYFSRNPTQTRYAGIWVVSMRTGERKFLLQAPSSAVYAAPGYLLYRDESRLLARPFDAKKLEFTGEPISLAHDLWYDPSITALTSVSVSNNGTLAFRTGGMEKAELAWFDRSGRRLGRVWDPASYAGFSISPDGSTLSIARTNERTELRNIWLLNFDSGHGTQFTFEGDSLNSAWSPDGKRLLITSSQQGSPIVMWEKETGGESGLVRRPHPAVRQVVYPEWTSDGKLVVFEGDKGFWVLSEEDGTVSLYKEITSGETQPTVSPDGRWLAYSSDATGVREVYVESFPKSGRFWRVSTQGGAQPRWSPTGNELFYLSLDRKLMVVKVRRSDTTFSWESPQPLFQTEVIELGMLRGAVTYRVGPSGDNFLIQSFLQQGPGPAAVILNWQEQLPRR